MRVFQARFFILSVLLLASCGTSTKQDPELTQGGGKKQSPAPSGPCQGNYSPISLFVPGALPITDTENLPAGTYQNRGVEYFAREDRDNNLSQQVHYQEIFFDQSGILQPVCSTVINNTDSSEYGFPVMSLLTISAAGVKSRVDTTYLIQSYRGRYQSSRMASGAPVASGLASFLAKFTNARLYQTGMYAYEIHGELREFTPKGSVLKLVLQRIAFTPAPPPVTN